jgi:hypothetical protein
MSKKSYDYSTGQEIADELLRRVGDDADTSVEFMTEDSLIFAINELKRMIIHAPFSGARIDPEGRVVVRATGKGWDFKEEDKPLKFRTKTSLGALLANGETANATVADNTYMESANGAFIVYDHRGAWDYITHTAKSGSTLVTGVGNVDVEHAAGEPIEHLYKMPSDFDRAKSLYVDEIEMHEGKTDPDPGYFATYKGFLWMPRNFGAASGILTYFQKPVDISSLEETLDIPKELNMALLLLLEARAFYLSGEDENMLSKAYFAAADALEQAMGFTTSSSNKRLRLARRPSRSPTSAFDQRGISNFDEGNGYT